MIFHSAAVFFNQLQADASCVPLLQNECCTCVMVGLGDGVAGVLAIKDPLKPEARGVVAALHQAGMACHLVTGDNWRTARSIAEQLGIINVSAECLPANKAQKIKVPPEQCCLSLRLCWQACTLPVELI